MVAEGVLENPKTDAAFALHCMPSLDVMSIGYTGGAVWADSNLVEIVIRGKKAHAAYPHEGCDAVVVASHIVVALQTLSSRRLDSRDANVLTIGEMHAGNAYNILAESATLTGTLRTHSVEVTEQAKAEILRTVMGCADAFGAKASVRFVPGAKPTLNDGEVEQRMLSCLRDVVDPGTLVKHPPQMGAEDFSAISSVVPSCYLFLGIRNERKKIVHELHTPQFDVDEACIPFAVEAFANGLLAYGASGVKADST
jgi:amidohydrolase